MNDRKVLLEKIIRLQDATQLTGLLSLLEKHEWDSDEPLIRLMPQDVAAILKKFLTGDLTQEQVHQWAEGVEVREDIEFGVSDEEGYNDEFTLELIYELANSLLEGRINPERAKQLIAEIEAR